MLRVPLLAAVAILAACGRSGTGPEARDAWVRAVPPTANMTAAYLVIENPGAEPAVLVGVESPLFADAEVHATITEEGVSRMRHQPRVEIPAGGRVVMAPGGLHIMLMQPASPVADRSAVPLVLLFEDGRRLAVDAPVGRPED